MPNMTHNLSTIHSIATSQQMQPDNEHQDWSASTARGDLERDIEKAQNKPGGSTGPSPEMDPTVVTWSGPDDPENPQNWPKTTRCFYVSTLISTCPFILHRSVILVLLRTGYLANRVQTGILALMTWVVTFASSVFSTGTRPVMAEFGVSEEVATLGTSLFVLGFGLGPMIWGPLSEIYGRMLPLFFAFGVFAIFQIPVAVAQNIETILICRFLGGFFAVAPLAIIGGAFADIWGSVDRGIAIALFAAATFVGPVRTSFSRSRFSFLGVFLSRRSASFPFRLPAEWQL